MWLKRFRRRRLIKNFSASRLIRRANWVSALFAWERQSLLLEPAVPLKSAPNRFQAPPPDNLVMQPEKITYGWWRVSQSEMVISYIILLYYWIVRDILKGSIEQLAQNLKNFPTIFGTIMADANMAILQKSCYNFKSAFRV